MMASCDSHAAVSVSVQMHHVKSRTWVIHNTEPGELTSADMASVPGKLQN